MIHNPKTSWALTNLWGSSIMAVLMFEHDVTWAFWVFLVITVLNLASVLFAEDS